MSTTADQQTGDAVLDTVVERFQLKSLVEACLLVEEGVAQIKDIDMGMMMGAGIIPGPFAAADERGLDEIVKALENAPASWGDWTEPPVLLRRLVPPLLSRCWRFKPHQFRAPRQWTPSARCARPSVTMVRQSLPAARPSRRLRAGWLASAASIFRASQVQARMAASSRAT